MKNSSTTGFGLDDGYITSAMKAWDVPGLSIAIVKDGRTVFSHGYGQLHCKKEGRVNRDTLFTIGSCTKAFTTVAIAMLVAEGKCRWDDPLVKYVPEIAFADPTLTATVTLKDVVTHQSGVEDGAITDIPARTLKQAIKHLATIKAQRPHRGGFSYNNTLFAVLGKAVAEISGLSWEAFLQTRILSPLGMNMSFPTLKSASDESNRAVAHQRPTDAKRVKRMKVKSLDHLASSAGLQSNITDMAAWLKFQLGMQDLLPEAALDEMHSEQLVLEPNPFTLMMHPGSDRHGYGMAWFVRHYAGCKIVQHGGYVDGYTSFSVMGPEKGFGVVVLTNMHNSLLPFALAYRVIDAYLDVSPTDWSEYFLAKRAEHRNKVSPHEKENAREQKRMDKAKLKK
jgi:CubicO group peptidase (beta-lactamase class C family)